MKVVEKDTVISGMLKDELDRNRKALRSLNQFLTRLPKGTVHVRTKAYKGKTYHYSYLKFRDAVGRSVSIHIAHKNLAQLKLRLGERAKIEKEASAYKKRIEYLERILIAKS